MQLSPSFVLTIPNEITCRIFDFASFTSSDFFRNTMPLAVSHVCRSWRNIAINYPPLWTHIILEDKPKTILFATLCANRAGPHAALFITVRCRGNTLDQTIVGTWLGTRSLSIKAMRVVHFARSQFNHLLTIMPSLSLTRLETFELLGLEEVNIPSLETVASILATTPSLQTLALSGLETWTFHASFRGVARGLTHLSIGALSHVDHFFPIRVDAALEIIACCTNLRVLECFSLADEEDNTPPVTALPHLSSLTIGDEPETCRLLQYLAAPRLNKFVMAHGQVLNEMEQEIGVPHAPDEREGYEDYFMECLYAFFNASHAPVITQLTWEGCVVGSELLESCGPYLQGLEHAELIGMQAISGSIFLPANEGSIQLHPHLKSLSFVECSIDPVWYDNVRTLYQRTPNLAQLNRYPRITFRRCIGVSDICLGG